jgi:hypothetical protein
MALRITTENFDTGMRTPAKFIVPFAGLQPATQNAITT